MPTGTEPPPGQWAQAVSDAVVDLLTARGVLRYELAEDIGLEVSTLSRTLNHHRSFTLDELSRVARALDVPPASIIIRANALLPKDSPDRA